MQDRDLIREVKEAVESSAQVELRWREAAREDLAMLCGEEHWPADVVAGRKSESRPVLTVNRLPKFVQSIVGEYRLNQFQIRVRPADNAADPAVAEIYEGLIRAIQYESMARVAYRTALAAAVTIGRGWLRVAREYEQWDAWDQVVRLKPVPNPFSVYPDPKDLTQTLGDAAYVAILEEYSEAEFKRRWPDASPADIDGQTGDLKRSWYNKQDKTVTVAEYWRREPVRKKLLLVGLPEDPASWQTVLWPRKEAERAELIAEVEASGLRVLRDRDCDGHRMMVSLVCGGDVLEKPEEQPGHLFPLVPVYGETYVFDGERRSWGIVRHAKDPQRAYNYQWTAAVEQVAMQPRAPYVLSEDEYAGHEQYWDNANKGNLPVLVYRPDPKAPGRPQRQAPPQIPSAALALAQQAGQDLMETTGVYQASLGDQTAAAEPGVAIEARRQAGATVTASYQDNLVLAIEQAGKVIVDMIPHVYDAARIVRILGEDGQEAQTAQINGPGLPDVTRGRYDVVIDVGAAYQTRRQEAQRQLMESAKLLGPQAVLLLDKVYQYGDFPGKDELVERIQQIQAMMGFQDGGGLPPQLGQEIQAMVGQMLQASVPAPEQIQQLVMDTIGRFAGQMPGGPM